MSDWLIYRGTGRTAPERIRELPGPPRWRKFDGVPQPDDTEDAPAAPPPIDDASLRRLGSTLMRRQDDRTLELINAALYLRRPLLVTGDPGTGKSTLAHAVAHELGLGRVLQWPVVSRTALKDGLYTYDAIARLQDTQLAAQEGASREEREHGIGRYVRLGPLGTALLPARTPRVLLIDELDKSDIDLPNDLLHVVEEGEFAIPELERIADRPGQETVQVLTDDGRRVPVTGGRVRCHAFPFIVMTSNDERDFPPALLRRCIQLRLPAPRGERLAAMVQAHFGEGADERNEDLFGLFSSGEGERPRPTDELLHAIFLTQHATVQQDPARRREIARLLIEPRGHENHGHDPRG